MRINAPITWGVNNPVMKVSYNRNLGLVMDADLVLFVVDADVSVRTQSCSDPCLKWDAELLKLA